MSEFSNYLIPGLVWRHHATGELRGPVQPEFTAGKQGKDARPTPGPIDTAVHFLILAALALFVLAVGWDARRGGAASVIPMMAVVGCVAIFVGIAVNAGYAATSLRVRAIMGSTAVVILLAAGAHAVLIVAVLALTLLAVAGRYYSPKAINRRIRAEGFVECLPDVPGGYTGFWYVEKDRRNQYKDGKLVACGRMHQVPSGNANAGRSEEFFQPVPSEKFPYGWVFDSSLPGYVPRRSNPFESPIPEVVRHIPEPDIVSPHKPRAGDDLDAAMVRHQYTLPDGKIVQGDFPRPASSRKYPYGWVFDPSVPGYVPRQGDPFESPAPQTFPPEPESDAYGKNKPRDDDDLRRDGAAHPWPEG